MRTAARTTTLALSTFLASILCLPHTSVAESGSVGPVAAKWGLYGTWAIDCGQPSSLANPYRTYSAAPRGTVRDGVFQGELVMNDLWRDKDAARRQIFTGVRPGTDGMIELHTIIGDDIVALEKHQKDAFGRMRVFYSIDLRSGLVWIENALVSRQGPELDRSPELFPWLTRCTPATN
jgi:hypothetical protein